VAFPKAAGPTPAAAAREPLVSGLGDPKSFATSAPSINQAFCVAAIDPGATSGALAFVFASHLERVSAEDLPIVDGLPSAAILSARLEQMRPDVVVIERASAMPKQGVSSSFKFGVGYGIAQGVVAALKIPVHFVAASKWKRRFGLTADKEEARARALQLWPARSDIFSRKRDHHRAEAALLARYFAEMRDR